jgi:glycosyltransferase involved in cell wall biosynthesis
MCTAPSWHLISGEYPPQHGGVSDYTRQLALALAAAGEEVHVWTSSNVILRQDGRVKVHGIRGFGPSGLRRLSAQLDATPGPKRLFVQFVAPAFGLRGVNVLFCLWLAERTAEEVWVQFHEVAHGFSWGQAPRHNILALVQWWMAQLIAQRAERIFISIPGWRRQLGRHADRAEVLPIPSNVPDQVAEGDVASIRARLGTGSLIGHFGTYGRFVTELLEPAVVAILRSAPDARFLLLGRGGPRFAGHVASTYPDLALRIVAPGPLEASSVSTHLVACDLLLQPYPDGISGRRTSAMAGLALGKPIVTTTGHLTEEEWSHSESVVLTPVGRAEELARTTVRLLSAQSDREALGARARAWYRARFSIEHTLEVVGVQDNSDKVEAWRSAR